MMLKKLLKREWNWHKGSGEQKELYIKTLERVIIQLEERVNELEKR